MAVCEWQVRTQVKAAPLPPFMQIELGAHSPTSCTAWFWTVGDHWHTGIWNLTPFSPNAEKCIQSRGAILRLASHLMFEEHYWLILFFPVSWWQNFGRESESLPNLPSSNNWYFRDFLLDSNHFHLNHFLTYKNCFMIQL